MSAWKNSEPLWQLGLTFQKPVDAKNTINQENAALLLLMFNMFEVDCSSFVLWKRSSFSGLSALTVDGQRIATVWACYGVCMLSNHRSPGSLSLCSSNAYSPIVGTVPGHLCCGLLSLCAWGLKEGIKLLLVPSQCLAFSRLLITWALKFIILLVKKKSQLKWKIYALKKNLLKAQAFLISHIRMLETQQSEQQRNITSQPSRYCSRGFQGVWSLCLRKICRVVLVPASPTAAIPWSPRAALFFTLHLCLKEFISEYSSFSGFLLQSFYFTSSYLGIAS